MQCYWTTNRGESSQGNCITPQQATTCELISKLPSADHGHQEPAAGKVRLQAVMDAGAWDKLDDKSKRHKKKKVANSRCHDDGSAWCSLLTMMMRRRTCKRLKVWVYVCKVRDRIERNRMSVSLVHSFFSLADVRGRSQIAKRGRHLVSCVEQHCCHACAIRQLKVKVR